MTFNPVAALNIIECKSLIEEKKPKAMDLGSQTSSLSSKFIKNLIEKSLYINNIQKKNLEKLTNMEFSTKDFFQSLGYESYMSIDINGAHESYQFDLNKNIIETYQFNNKYDLVINNGTGEHVFDQHSLFINFHNLTKKDGLMLNLLPFIDWINHGFYNFNPIFFADLAASNNYDLIKISFANRDGLELKLDKKDYAILFEQIKPNRNDTKFEKVIKLAKEKIGKNIILVVILRKKNDQSFKLPLQGKYLRDVQDFATPYQEQNLGSQVASNQLADNDKRK